MPLHLLLPPTSIIHTICKMVLRNYDLIFLNHAMPSLGIDTRVVHISADPTTSTLSGVSALSLCYISVFPSVCSHSTVWLFLKHWSLLLFLKYLMINRKKKAKAINTSMHEFQQFKSQKKLHHHGLSFHSTLHKLFEALSDFCLVSISWVAIFKPTT